VVKNQDTRFNEAITPILKSASASTVRIWAGPKRVAYGTVIRDGRQVLTKWSEVSRTRRPLTVSAEGSDATWPAKITGVYEKEDLAVLTLDGAPTLKAADWAEVPLNPGTFIASPQPDGRMAAFGVVSVAERNLRQTDAAYLGVNGTLDFDGKGVLVESVAKESGAKTAGIRPGDIITHVNDRPISGVMELRNALVGLDPGSTAKVALMRAGKPLTLDVPLRNRPDLPTFPNERLQFMETMGGDISRVRDSFSSAVQTDMRPKPDQIGGPVVNLKGQIVGITLARTDRTRSFIMPSKAVRELLAQPATDPAAALTARNEMRRRLPAKTAAHPQPDGFQLPDDGAPEPLNEERIRARLEHMQRLMDAMRQDLEDFELQRETDR
jgi:S1-C subfamily serine protease